MEDETASLASKLQTTLHLSASDSDSKDTTVDAAPKLVSSLSLLSAGDQATLKSSSELALDCEGVDLGRQGEVSLIQIATSKQCFLFDVLGKSRSDALVAFVKELLESSTIVKIIHDCKMDADALHHELGITLKNVHDTQAWDKALEAREDNLNNTLLRYGLSSNVHRDHGMYQDNHRFWATRPVTRDMINWASGDVTQMFALRKLQVERATARGAVPKCDEASRLNLEYLSPKITGMLYIDRRMMGRLIGKGGSNLRNLMMRVPGSFYQQRGKRTTPKAEIMVYAPDAASLERAIHNARESCTATTVDFGGW